MHKEGYNTAEAICERLRTSIPSLQPFPTPRWECQLNLDRLKLFYCSERLNLPRESFAKRKEVSEHVRESG